MLCLLSDSHFVCYNCLPSLRISSVALWHPCVPDHWQRVFSHVCCHICWRPQKGERVWLNVDKSGQGGGGIFYCKFPDVFHGWPLMTNCCIETPQYFAEFVASGQPRPHSSWLSDHAGAIALINWYSSWFSSGAVLTMELSIQLLTNHGEKNVKHIFVRRAVISSTPYKLAHSQCIWLVLCIWLAESSVLFVKIHKKC